MAETDLTAGINSLGKSINGAEIKIPNRNY